MKDISRKAPPKSFFFILFFFFFFLILTFSIVLGAAPLPWWPEPLVTETCWKWCSQWVQEKWLPGNVFLLLISLPMLLRLVSIQVSFFFSSHCFSFFPKGFFFQHSALFVHTYSVYVIPILLRSPLLFVCSSLFIKTQFQWQQLHREIQVLLL